MSERLAKTQRMLARHHRDGERFARLMQEGFSERFDEAFWASWRQWIEPVYSPQPVVLDLGAGPCLFVRAVAARSPGARVIGVECAPYMVEAAGELPPDCELIQEDLHDPRLPLSDASVDAAMASVVLHEMTQPVRALRELHRCLKPGGRLYLLDWVRAPLELYIRHQTQEAKVFGADTSAGELDDLFMHFVEHNRFSREDLIYMLEQCGFAVIDSELLREGRFARIIAERRAG